MLTAQVSHRYAALRDELRAHTHDQHERLHAHSGFVALFGETLSLGDYRALIRRLYGFYLPLDRAIGRVLAGGAVRCDDYTYARRAGLLAQDLRDLGGDEAMIDASPECRAVAGLVTPASLGGVIYVIEGAMLGGARIDRAAHRLLARDDPAGRRFWAWCRAEGGQRWPMTTRYLDRIEAEGADIRALKAGAHDTFRLLADWLAPLDRSPPATEARLP